MQARSPRPVHVIRHVDPAQGPASRPESRGRPKAVATETVPSCRSEGMHGGRTTLPGRIPGRGNLAQDGSARRHGTVARTASASLRPRSRRIRRTVGNAAERQGTRTCPGDLSARSGSQGGVEPPRIDVTRVVQRPSQARRSTNPAVRNRADNMHPDLDPARRGGLRRNR